MAGLLLLVSCVAAIAIAKRDKPAPVEEEMETL